jgi:pimeloyl-ACP methyl ester carboxylesterase
MIDEPTDEFALEDIAMKRAERRSRGAAQNRPRPTNGTAPPELRAPGLAKIALEWRAPWEAGAMVASLPLLQRTPNGDGHSVLVFPGFLAGDLSTWPLRSFLLSRGYLSHAWDFGFNLGPRNRLLERCVEYLHEIQRASGRRVSLIGWSLGGVYAREIAKLAPDATRCVISLGSPFSGPRTATNAWRLYEMLNGTDSIDAAQYASLSDAPPVPTTSILSKTDGVVAWQCSVQTPHPDRQSENIEIVASHVGMGLNPFALYAIADRLSQPEGAWLPFDRSGWRERFFRHP